MKHCVVTTINKPTKAIAKLYEKFGENLIIVGDEKTPKDWGYKNIVSIGCSDVKYAPLNHYARKNFGYIDAIKSNATIIYDTDDDTYPNENWEVRDINCITQVYSRNGWLNIHSEMGANGWPRGFPLDKIKKCRQGFPPQTYEVYSPIQQGLINGDPDVDAIWRLTRNEKIEFTNKKSVALLSNTWCPFNSQSTWWFPVAYPLMYLPVYANFRMTDIWRSFVAQRCLWEIAEVVTFHSPAEVIQERNEHDLMKDFEDEIPGYLHNDKIIEILSGLKLKSGKENICGNLLACYTALINNNILPKEEILSVRAWVKDYENVATTLEHTA